MIDLVILKALSKRKHFVSTIRAIPTGMLDSNSTALLHWYNSYFTAYPDHQEIDFNALRGMIQLRLKDSTNITSLLATISTVLDAQIDPTVLENITNQIEELAFSGKLGQLLTRYNNGEEIDLTYEVQILATTTKERMSVLSQSKWANDDILKYLEEDADETGLQFTTFDVLKDNLKGLHAGHNVAVVAPTDKGKTSLLCRFAVDFAKQAKDLEGYRDSCILYLVNEGLAETITPRIYCTALAMTRPAALESARQGTLVDKYIKVVGKRDAIRLVNVHGMNVSQVAKIIEAHKPYMVISDMTGRIKASKANKGSNELQDLEDVWNSLRELSAMHRFIHIGTIQVSAEGMNQLYPPLTAMQWSKVGIQTTLDLCIMVGAIDDENNPDLRGISTPKNKLARSGCRAENRFETIFSGELNIWS